MVKKTTLDDLGEMIRYLVAASADYATKDDIEALETKLTDKIDAIDSKLSGIGRRLESEAMQRSELDLPHHVHELEEKYSAAHDTPSTCRSDRHDTQVRTRYGTGRHR